MAGAGQSLRKLTMEDIRAAAERLKNWGKWGADDEIGTLNYTRPEDIVAAAQLVRKGKVISLALPYGHFGGCAEMRHRENERENGGAWRSAGHSAHAGNGTFAGRFRDHERNA